MSGSPALDLLKRWDAPYAAAGVVGGEPPTVLATTGELGRPLAWASVTKLATALATLVAAEEGSIGLDDPAGPAGSTVRHLLAHASGLAYDDDRVVAAPAARRIYSNTGFEVVASVVAARTAIPFRRYLAEAVLEPLAMSSTELGGSPASGLKGPLADMLRLAAEFLSPTLVSAETMADATTVAFPGLSGVLPGFGRQQGMDWGLGFELRDAKAPHWTGTGNSASTFGHFGAAGSFLWVDPDRELACTVLTGRDFGDWAKEAWPEFSDAVLAEFAGR